jgi:hypothetical protein
VLARIVEPVSKLDSLRVLAEAGIEPASYGPSALLSWPVKPDLAPARALLARRDREFTAGVSLGEVHHHVRQAQAPGQRGAVSRRNGRARRVGFGGSRCDGGRRCACHRGTARPGENQAEYGGRREREDTPEPEVVSGAPAHRDSSRHAAGADAPAPTAAHPRLMASVRSVMLLFLPGLTIGWRCGLDAGRSLRCGPGG